MASFFDIDWDMAATTIPPESCFEKPPSQNGGGERKVDLAHPQHCIACGACVVQCPEDALYFEDEKGTRVEPDTIRRFATTDSDAAD